MKLNFYENKVYQRNEVNSAKPLEANLYETNKSKLLPNKE